MRLAYTVSWITKKQLKHVQKMTLLFAPAEVLNFENSRNI